MKFKLAAAVLAATTAFATPAFAADFTGPRVAVNVGLADDDFGGAEAFTYGINAGYDFDLGGAVVGGTIEYQDSSEDGAGRDLSATVRAGGKAGENVLIYGLAGYTNLGVEDADFNLDGFRTGAGVEVALGSNAFGQVEYRYSNYELDVDGHQFVVGVGFRF
jgi:outer membrane immunogenic protein